MNANNSANINIAFFFVYDITAEIFPNIKL